ncbi:hypothetical protein [Williamsia phyllosphaerae]|uniref:Insoluble domain protein n=1 Tax=Williamsia phyllosphaerae TaxID=885042 RepID=A0ABQ1UFQ3_9NOCA|nr:hypothetical protein [Williamsia phyllosphaerae]GGF17006.1 hypothetical protein GCM10007298_11280 [Williamsia phyllosphaerae]
MSQQTQRITRTTAGVVIAAAIASGAAGQALAAPPGSAPPSGDTAPGSAPPSQAPTPAPAPAPPAPQGRSIIPAATFDAPPVYEGSPDYVAPVFNGSYNPAPPVLRAPQRVKPVNPILPRPGIIKLGNFRTPQPAWLSDADARNLNGQAATIEARTATYYESIGFPPDQAARTAASTTVGALIGGTAGAIALGIPAAVVGGVVGAGVGTAAGAITGAVVGAPGGPAGSAALAGPGALIGLGVGTGVGIAGGAAGGAVVGAGIGGVIGGAIGYAVGAGDPGGDPNAPLGATNEDPRKSKPAPPNPDANQYELHLDDRGLPGGGKVDYVVAKNGDVTGNVRIGAVNVPIDIDHAQADAPYQAAGVFAQTARDSVAAAVENFGREALRAFPNLRIEHPQYAAASAGGKHRK